MRNKRAWNDTSQQGQLPSKANYRLKPNIWTNHKMQNPLQPGQVFHMHRKTAGGLVSNLEKTKNSWVSFQSLPTLLMERTKWLLLLNISESALFWKTLYANKSLNQLVFYSGHVFNYLIRPNSCCVLLFSLSLYYSLQLNVVVYLPIQPKQNLLTTKTGCASYHKFRLSRTYRSPIL